MIIRIKADSMPKVQSGTLGYFSIVLAEAGKECECGMAMDVVTEYVDDEQGVSFQKCHYCGAHVYPEGVE